MQKLPVILLIALLTTGCSNLRFPWVYRIDIPQGNFVTQDMLAELQPGMTPEQVEYVLGVPTIEDPFTPDTWFYLMTYEPGKGDIVRQEIVVHFEQGSYSHYTGSVVEDLKSRTTGSSDRNLQRQADQRQRDVDTVALPAGAPEADADAQPDSEAEAQGKEDSAGDERTEASDATQEQTETKDSE